MRRSPLVRATLCGWVVLLAAAPASGQTKPPPGPITAGSSPTLQGFSVVLVLGSHRDSNETFGADLPRGATRALKDMSEFLPYKSYKLLDSAWILNPGGRRVASRMRGVDNHTFEATLDSSADAGSRIAVRFALRDIGVITAATTHSGGGTAVDGIPGDVQAETAKQRMRLIEIEKQLEELRARKTDPRDTDLTKKLQEYAESQARYRLLLLTSEKEKRVKSLDAVLGARIIDTSFTMDVGETVVVGTSRLQGDIAMIALLTAVPRATK